MITSRFLTWLELKILQTPLYSAWKTIIKRKQNRDNLPMAVRKALAMREHTEELPDWMEGWISQVERRLKKSGLKIPLGRYLLGMILGAVVGTVIGLAMLKNVAVAIILGMSAFLIPDIILVTYIQKRRTKLIEQLGTAVRVFAVEFRDTPQVGRALRRTAIRIPSPLGDVLDQACKELAAGKKKDEVLGRMMEELDFDYGRIFVQLLRMAWDDASVQPLFSRLATRIASLQSLIAKNNSSLAYGRVMAMIVNALIVPVYIVVQWKVPGAAEYMTTHPVGKLLVTMSFLSVLVGLVLDRYLSGVKV
ncbi:MAG: hypothetical protein H0Z24_03510 [Thermosipho sp. (in: Bacteria)]|nr:hypothetical protein [Thermosipho sp. (in: thermotogales)]